MGAATAIMYLKENPGTVNCMALDSGYATLIMLMQGMAGQMGIPPDFVHMLVPMIDGAVHQKAGFHLNDLDTESCAKECEVPAYFFHGQHDNFVVPEHSEKNYNAYKGTKKSFKKVMGDHNAERPQETIKEVCTFFKENM